MRKLFLANWKMYLSDADAEALARLYVDAALTRTSFEAAVAPGFTALDRVARLVRGTPVELAAQDVFWMDGGAYTGEVSAPQLAALGARYVIVGHSERRTYLGETDAMVAEKAVAAQNAGLMPVVCVGETKEEREAGAQDRVVRAQVETALSGAACTSERPLVVAYEPRWAIGTGVACRLEDVVAMHGLVRSTVEAMKGNGALACLRVLYGGSVDPSNAAEFFGSKAVDGVLVGGASTRPDDVRALFEAFSA